MKTSNIILLATILLGILCLGIDIKQFKVFLSQPKPEPIIGYTTVPLDSFDKIILNGYFPIKIIPSQKNELKYWTELRKHYQFEVKNNVLTIKVQHADEEDLYLKATNIRQIEIKKTRATIIGGQLDSLFVTEHSGQLSLDRTAINYLHITAQKYASISSYHYDNLSLIKHIDVELNDKSEADLQEYKSYLLTGKISEHARIKVGDVQKSELKVLGNKISIGY